MSTIAPVRPHSTASAAPPPPRLAWLTTEHATDVRQSLEGLVETFETKRIDTSATHGAIHCAAYDAGVRSAVHEALDDLETGRYGDCATCEAPIAAERLRSVPYARRCSPCQQIEERRWNQFERAMAGVVRARVGEPQGRVTNAPPNSYGQPLPDARKAGR